MLVKRRDQTKQTTQYTKGKGLLLLRENKMPFARMSWCGGLTLRSCRTYPRSTQATLNRLQILREHFMQITYSINTPKLPCQNMQRRNLGTWYRRLRWDMHCKRFGTIGVWSGAVCQEELEPNFPSRLSCTAKPWREVWLSSNARLRLSMWDSVYGK